MRLFAAPICAMTAVLVAACAGAGEPGGDQDTGALQRVLVGQVLLPQGNGSRGVEVVLTVTDAEGENFDVWVLLDEQGRFAHTIRRPLTSVTVSTGIRAELHRIESDGLLEVDRSGRIDVGVIDLRGRLIRHRLVLRAAEGAPQGEVRVAMCFGLPPVGPGGERIALGSRQFPPVSLGSEVEWLLPHEAQSIYFLVERPGSGGEWRGGRQQLFGPFALGALPAELTME